MSDLEARCEQLLARGNELCSKIEYGEHGASYWFAEPWLPDLQAWIASVTNFFRLSASPDMYFAQECQRIVEDERLSRGVPFHSAQKLVGLLASMQDEMQGGLLRKAEYIFVGATFDDFIDHAAEYHKGGKKIESAVLVSAVFEDTLRKAATKFGIPQKGEELEVLIDNLVKGGHTTLVKAKRYKSYASLRNHALHAQWDDFDIKDVGMAINGTREMIEEML